MRAWKKPQGFGPAHDRRPEPGARRTAKGRMTADWAAVDRRSRVFFRPGATPAEPAARSRRAVPATGRSMIGLRAGSTPLPASPLPGGRRDNGGGPPFVRRRRCRGVLSAPSALLPPYSSLLPPFRGEVGRGVPRRRGWAARVIPPAPFQGGRREGGTAGVRPFARQRGRWTVGQPPSRPPPFQGGGAQP